MREHNRLAFEPRGEGFLHAAESYPEVSQDERRYYAARMADLLLLFQGAHALYEAGRLEEETYEAYLDFVAASLATPGSIRYWQQVREIFTARMVAALDARLTRGDLPNLVRLASTSKSRNPRPDTALRPTGFGKICWEASAGVGWCSCSPRRAPPSSR